jgi:uncharacterized protein involved in outer membrane biogenesis
VRVLARIAGAAILLLMLLVVAVALVLPRIVDSAAIREQIADLAAPTLGRRPEFQELGYRLFPPSLVMKDAAPGTGGDSSARPERIELTIALPPLLVGIVLIDAALVDDAHLLLVRTAGGVRLDGSNPAGFHPVDPKNIALRSLELRSATITLDDRSIDPTVQWQLRNVEASAVAEALDAPIRLDLVGEVATGGGVVARGNFSLGGDIDVVLQFESFAIAAARPYFASSSDVGGMLTGSIRASGSSANPKLELDATLRDARLQLGDISLRGVLEVDVSIDDAWGAPRGTIELDATQAELAYAQFFTKPPGTPATVVGRIAADSDGSPAIEAWKFVMEDLDGQVRIRFGDPIPLAMSGISTRKNSDSARGGGVAGASGEPDRALRARFLALGGIFGVNSHQDRRFAGRCFFWWEGPCTVPFSVSTMTEISAGSSPRL